MLPPLSDISEIHRRLLTIFPEGTPQRGYCTREMAARTVFVMLYVGAVEGHDAWMGPKHVYRMGTAQSEMRDAAQRQAWTAAVEKPGFVAPPGRWFQDNTREPIRDETLKEGLVRMGAVVTRPGLATTSSKGRYALQTGFAALFDPALTEEPLAAAIVAWQTHNLSAGALARVQLQQRSATAAQSKVLVTLPNGETRHMEAGPSSVITRAVIEIFAKRFLGNPVALWISESGNKIIQRDDTLAKALNLKIEADKLLPDTILVDLAPADPLLIFIEMVATDGPITESRRSAFLAMAEAAGLKASQIAFVTAFQDRDTSVFKKAIPNLAWGSFAWFVSEPNQLVHMRDGSTSSMNLHQLLQI